MSYIRTLARKNLLNVPKHVVSGIQYETIVGSVAYGVNNDNSDTDIYGFSIPYKDMIFPHLRGEIGGFGTPYERFEQYQEHHVKDQEKEYDITIFSIVKFMHFCMKNNPNFIDTLFTPRRCILYTTRVGELVREKRYLFLHKGAWHAFKGYAYNQMHKMEIKNPEPGSNRALLIEKYGYDIDFAYHVVRLLNEVEQILIEGDLDIERNREQLKSIRRGEWKEEDIKNYFATKEKDLEKVYLNSKLPYGPNEKLIKQLLIDCLELHFGSLERAIEKPRDVDDLVNDLRHLIGRYE